MKAVHKKLWAMRWSPIQPMVTESLISPRYAVAAPHENGKHIIEVLIEERCTKLRKSIFWPLLRAGLYPLLNKGAAVRMANEVANLSAQGAMDYVSNLLSMQPNVTTLENIPEKGPILVAPTHPTGIADGVAIWQALRERRPDMIFFANRDAVRAAPQLADVIIPVEWLEEKRSRTRSRETLLATKQAFKEERCVILFPSGRLAYMDENKVLTEREWQPTVSILARKYNVPIVPTHMRARNSWLYYWFWKLNEELRDITLFHELLNKKGKTFDITFGDIIPPEDLQGDPAEVTATLQEHAVTNVPNGAPFKSPISTASKTETTLA